MTTESSEASNFQSSNDPPASLPPTENLKFEQEDWTGFRTPETLQRKAGVPLALLRRQVMKELADNAFDPEGAEATIGELGDGRFFVEDNGPGIDGAPEEIAHLFSMNWPMISSKKLRLPTRGALGNGLRVVAGSVFASDGSLVVFTHDQRIELQPQHDGPTKVLSVTDVDFPVGTRIEIGFGPAIPEDAGTLDLASTVRLMAAGETYRGKSSPHWYDVSQFSELLWSCTGTLVSDLVKQLDGCTGARAGEIIAEAGLARTLCTDITPKQAEKLLKAARDAAKPVNPKRLGAVGPDLHEDYFYAAAHGFASFGTGAMRAQIPFVVETWAKEEEEMSLTACVNRTPVTGQIWAERDGRDIDFHGCGLHNTMAKAPKGKCYDILMNITTPYMPITSDGKEPDLKPFLFQTAETVLKSVRKATSRTARGDKVSIKSVVLDNLDDAIEAQGGLSFGERQLFYFLRPVVMEATGEELKLSNWKKIIGQYESDNGDIPMMFHPPRGSLIHPHRPDDRPYPLGTVSVAEYERPPWLFNKILYIEKEGAFEALRQVGWPEKHDCAVMSAVGFSTKAAKDLIDKLVEHDEEVQVFCATDADAYGGMIYQSLQEETMARGARKIKIIHFGLHPWEAVDAGLEVENLEETDTAKPIADYILAYDEENGTDWAGWLQDKRIELNAMPTPDLIEWLDERMEEFGDGKLVPPPEVLEAELAELVETTLRADITERVLREADLVGQVAAALGKIEMPDGAELTDGTAEMFEENPDREWRDHITDVMRTILKK